MREVVYPNSLDDGIFDVTAFIGSRAVTLDMVLRNTVNANGTGGKLHPSESQMRDEVLQYISPQRRPFLIFSEHDDTYVDSSNRVWSRVRYFVLRGSDAPISVARPQFNELSMSWVAPSGLMENVDYHQAVINFTEEDLDAEYRIHTHNGGSAPAWWTLTIDGDLESPMLELDGTRRLWLNYHIEEPGTVIINSRLKTVTIESPGPTGTIRRTVGYRYLDDRSDWFRIPPGDHVISLTHKSVQRAGKPYAYWQVDPQVVAHEGPSEWSKLTTTNRSADDDYLVEPEKIADLLTLKNHPTLGDGKYSGEQFFAGDYVVLQDGNQVFYDGVPMPTSNTGVWAAGYKPLSTEYWIWTPSIDDETGEPVRSVVSLTYTETYL